MTDATAQHNVGNRPLIELGRAPYDGAFARSALDVVLSYAAFAQNPLVLFSGAGVLALIDTQDATALGRKSLRKVIDSLPLYDLETVFVEQASLVRFGIAMTQLPDFASPLGDAELAALRAGARHVLSL